MAPSEQEELELLQLRKRKAQAQSGGTAIDETVPPKAATEGLAPGLTPPPVATVSDVRKTEPVASAEKPKARTSALSDVLNRGAIAQNLGGLVDLSNLALKGIAESSPLSKMYGMKYPVEKPVGGAESIGDVMQQAGVVSDVRRPTAELIAGLGPALLTGGAGLAQFAGKKLSGLVDAIRGVESEPLRKNILSELENLFKTESSKLGKTEKVLGQFEKQPEIALERAKATAATPDTEIPLKVREKLGGKVLEAREAEKQAAEKVKSAQSGVTSAEQSLMEAEQRVAKSQAAVDQVEASMSARPGMTADELGKDLQTATQRLFDEGNEARIQAAGYNKAFEAAGDRPTVNTKPIIESINKTLSQTRSPQLQNILSEIKSQLVTKSAGMQPGETIGKFVTKPRLQSTQEEALSLKNADSLKGYLDSVISGKIDKYGKLDKEIVKEIGSIKGQLMEITGNTHKEYKDAVSTFREMSRPLDIVERNGALKKVIDEDPVSTAYKMTEAEVTGHVIRKANAGSPVFQRLLQTDPKIKDSARLYFTKDLFGKESAPTAKSFETWLLNNERSLRQTGLYDEFNSLRNAQASASTAVSEAKGVYEATKGVVSEAKTAAQLAKQELSAAEKQTKSAESVAKKGTAKLEQALGAVETPEQIAARAARAETRAKEAKGKFEQTKKQKEATVNAISEFKTNISLAKNAKEIEQSVRATAEKLKDLNLITEEQRASILSQAQTLGKSIDARKDALTLIAKGIGYSGVGGLSLYGLKEFTSPDKR